MINNNNLLTFFYRLLVTLLLIVTAGCSLQQYGAVKFTSNPAGAEVINLRDDTVMGTTPTCIEFKGDAGSSEKVVVQFNKQGYMEKIFSVWVNKRHADQKSAIMEATEIHAELIKY